jgi:hypothetical protein
MDEVRDKGETPSCLQEGLEGSRLLGLEGSKRLLEVHPGLDVLCIKVPRVRGVKVGLVRMPSAQAG